MKLKALERKSILSIVGTRPNFMKIAPVAKQLADRNDQFNHLLIHTGQHYDQRMSEVFFRQLKLPQPDVQLRVGSGSHAYQTAEIMKQLEPIMIDLKPDLILVPGDVNSTLAAALVAAKLNIPIGHIESGLRSGDQTMPEEINRIVVDRISSLLFTHSPEAKQNLKKEGVKPSAIYEVGNTMIDTLLSLKENIRQSKLQILDEYPKNSYLVVTLHRPSLVDTELLSETLHELIRLAKDIPLVFPMHPRTYKHLQRLDMPRIHAEKNFTVTEPLGYLEFLHLVCHAKAVLTDSGGIQEETTFLDIPCFTLRNNTERPITISMGTNILLGLEASRIAEIPELLSKKKHRVAKKIPGWDGNAAHRIVDTLVTELLP